MIERNVRYFERPGQHNTEATIEAACGYLQENTELGALIVASISGRTALEVKRELGRISIPVVCVTGSPSWRSYPEYDFPLVPDGIRAALEKEGVTVVDSVPSSLSDTIEFSYARYGYRSPTWILVETLLAVGGYGLKTAVECAFMATDGGHVPPFREVLSMAGTGRGADTAVVLRSTFASTAFSSDPKKRLVLSEILAMPRNKVFHKDVTIGEWNIEEVKD